MEYSTFFFRLNGTLNETLNETLNVVEKYYNVLCKIFNDNNFRSTFTPSNIVEYTSNLPLVYKKFFIRALTPKHPSVHFLDDVQILCNFIHQPCTFWSMDFIRNIL